MYTGGTRAIRLRLPEGPPPPISLSSQLFSEEDVVSPWCRVSSDVSCEFGRGFESGCGCASFDDGSHGRARARTNPCELMRTHANSYANSYSITRGLMLRMRIERGGEWGERRT
eukprot:8743067-Pyramimonas_sp.AAC.1